MTCDVGGCGGDEDEEFWTPTGIQWLCHDCADWMASVYEADGVDYRRSPA